MKKILYSLFALFTLLLLPACEADPLPPQYNVQEDPNIENGWDFTMLESYFWGNVPTSTDTWVIEESDASYGSFLGLREALFYVAETEPARQITLQFPNLQEVPEEALLECSALVSAQFPVATTVGYYAFTNCTALVEVELPEATSVGERGFEGCSALETISLPYVTILTPYLFSNCSKLATATLPSATEVEEYAFLSCESLTTITLATTTQSSDTRADESNTSDSEMPTTPTTLATTTDEARLSYMAESAFEYTSTDAITLYLGGGNSDYVNGNTLAVGAFTAEFKEIFVDGVVQEEVGESVYLAELSATAYPTTSDIWEIQDQSASTSDFAGLSNAIATISAEDAERRITLCFPNMKSIPDYAIFGESVYNSSYEGDALVAVKAPVATSVLSYAFAGCENLQIAEFPKVTTLGEYAFYYCRQLATVDFTSLATIGKNAFGSCNALTSISCPLLTSIASSAFSGCDALLQVEFPLVTTVSSYGLAFCSNLERVELPQTTELSICAFSQCTALDTLYLATADGVELSSIYDNAFSGVTTEGITLYLGSANSSYVSGSTLAIGNFSAEFKEIIIDGVVQEIAPTVLAEYSATRYPTDTDTWVIEDATATTTDFAGLSAAIEQVSENETSRQITLEFPNLEEMPEYAIFGESSYSEVFASGALVGVTASKATSIGQHAFSYCKSLASVDFPLATTIAYCAFHSCSSLTSTNFPLVTKIASHAFTSSTSLQSVDFPQVTEIVNYAFHSCTGLTSVNFPQVTTIGSAVFYSCAGLTSMSLATNSGVKLSSITSDALLSATPSNITLYLGSENSDYVSGNTLTVGDFSAEFKEIVIDGEGQEGDSETTTTSIIFEETFDYTAGNPIVSGAIASTDNYDAVTGWYTQNNSDAGTTTFTVSDAPLTYEGYPLSGVGKGITYDGLDGQDLFKPFDAEILTDATLYVAFMINYPQEQQATSISASDFTVGIKMGTSASDANYASRLYVAYSGDYPGEEVSYGINKMSSGTTTWVSGQSGSWYAGGTTQLIVLKYNIGVLNGASKDEETDNYDDEMYLYVNPTMSSEAANTPILTHIDATQKDAYRWGSISPFGGLSALAFRSNVAGGSPAFQISGVRAATTWEGLFVE